MMRLKQSKGIDMQAQCSTANCADIATSLMEKEKARIRNKRKKRYPDILSLKSGASPERVFEKMLKKIPNPNYLFRKKTDFKFRDYRKKTSAVCLKYSKWLEYNTYFINVIIIDIDHIGLNHFVDKHMSMLMALPPSWLIKTDSGIQIGYLLKDPVSYKHAHVVDYLKKIKKAMISCFDADYNASIRNKGIWRNPLLHEGHFNEIEYALHELWDAFSQYETPISAKYETRIESKRKNFKNAFPIRPVPKGNENGDLLKDGVRACERETVKERKAQYLADITDRHRILSLLQKHGVKNPEKILKGCPSHIYGFQEAFAKYRKGERNTSLYLFMFTNIYMNKALRKDIQRAITLAKSINEVLGILNKSTPLGFNEVETLAVSANNQVFKYLQRKDRKNNFAPIRKKPSKNKRKEKFEKLYKHIKLKGYNPAQVSIRKLSRETGLHRNTVKKYLERIIALYTHKQNKTHHQNRTEHHDFTVLYASVTAAKETVGASHHPPPPPLIIPSQ